jgi:hypothetical protein
MRQERSLVPDSQAAFKEWADRACVDWPGELQAIAYRAWRDNEIDKFKVEYEKWASGIH